MSSSVNLELSYTNDVEFLPTGKLSLKSFKGVTHMAARIRHRAELHAFLDNLAESPDNVCAKVLITHTGHGNVSFLSTNTPHAHKTSPEVARIAPSTHHKLTNT
jgi:hypothetical protein